jgi:nucleotide-binding universal stress UspA family protein
MELGYEKILAAIDGTEASRPVLAHARAIASVHDGEVVVFHVRQQAYSGSAVYEVGPAQDVSTADAVNELLSVGIRARALEEDAYSKHTAKAIVAAAERESAKVIVIGSRGLGRLPASVLGSVAYKVVHLATQPVLVIP